MAGVKFNSIQMGRAAAALMVVVLHSGAVAEQVIGHEPRIANALNFGFAGVDLFFVISGFIISLVTDDKEREPVAFLWRRVVRILPLYALFTAAKLVLLVAAHKALPNAPFIIASFTDFPTKDMPVLFVGWSLQYEAIFYLTVAALLAVRRLEWLPFVLGLMFAMGVLLHGFPFRVWDFHLVSLYHLEFLAGVMIYRWRRHVVGVPWVLCVGLGAMAFAGASMATRSLEDHVFTSAEGSAGLVRVVTCCLASVLVMIGLVAADLQNSSFLKTPWAKAGIFVGDASFTLYLVHPIVIDFFEFIVAKIRLAPIMAVPLMVLTIAACIAAALLFYRFAELPYREWARRLHRSAKPTAVAQSTTA